MDHIKCAPSIFSHMKTFTPSPDASHAPVIGAEQAHEDARGAYGSADREWGLPQKSSLLEGFDFKTLRLISHFLRLTTVSRNPFRTTLVWLAYYFVPLKIHLFYLYLPKSSYNKNRYWKIICSLFTHTPTSGAKPALLCTVPDLVRSIRTPFRRLHLTPGLHAEHLFTTPSFTLLISICLSSSYCKL